MGAQTKYGYATGRGIAGGIYDMYHYPVDSRFNEEENGVMHFGVGVVRGSIPGSNIVLPKEASTAADFEGVIVNGFDRQQDLEGKLYILKNQNVGVMRRGKIWAQVKDGDEPVYGAELHLIVEGEEAGKFSTNTGVKIAGRFIGDVSDGIAPIELYGTDGVTAPAGTPDKG